MSYMFSVEYTIYGGVWWLLLLASYSKPKGIADKHCIAISGFANLKFMHDVKEYFVSGYLITYTLMHSIEISNLASFAFSDHQIAIAISSIRVWGANSLWILLLIKIMNIFSYM